MFKKWLVKNNNQEVILKSFYNKTKEFADKVVINYNLDNDNYVCINLIKKDYDQKGNNMTLEKLASIVMNGFKEVNSRIDKIENRLDKLEMCPTISHELKKLN